MVSLSDGVTNDSPASDESARQAIKERGNMMFDDLVRSSRSNGRFDQETSIGMSTLRELVDLARYSPSAGNLQPLKYVLSSDPEKNALIFRDLGWAVYLKDWSGPEERERPSAYIGSSKANIDVIS